jgi:hypothetical protein
MIRMNDYLIIAAIAGILVFLCMNALLGLNIFGGVLRSVLNAAETVAETIGKYNIRRYIERIRREKLEITKETPVVKYNRLVESLIFEFNLPLTLESFNTMILIVFIIAVLCIVFFLKSITLSFMFVIALFIGGFTIFVMTSKNIKSARIEHIMDAEDILCPLAKDGVFFAIKKTMENNNDSIHENIRPYFQQFIDNYEINGYSFKQAILLLNAQLGPKFDSFTKKAVIFEANERKGMAEVFMDIIDENAVLREINARKDRIFYKMNRDFFIKTLMILLFYLYALTVTDFNHFMMDTQTGKMINTIAVSAICLSFARCQALQSNLE